MAEVGRYFWGHLVPLLCLSRASLLRLLSRLLLNISINEEYTAPLGNLGLHHPHNEEVFPDVQRKPPTFQFGPIAFGPGNKHWSLCWSPHSGFSQFSIHLPIHSPRPCYSSFSVSTLQEIGSNGGQYALPTLHQTSCFITVYPVRSQPCWLLLMISWYLMCLEMVSRISFSITFPGSKGKFGL